MKKNSQYVLATGQKALKTLEMQNKYLLSDSLTHLKKANIGKGSTVWDIGSGCGHMLKSIRDILGENGKLISIDINEEQLKIASSLNHHKNNTFIKADINSLNTLEKIAKADVIYARLLLMHISDPLKAISNLKLCLKFGGKLLLQESTFHTIDFEPQSSYLKKYKETLIQLGQKRGVDYNIGEKLPNLCIKAGFKTVEHYTSVQKLSIKDGAETLLERLDEWSKEAIKEDLLNQTELLQIENELKSMKTLKEGFISFADQTHVIAEV